MLRYFRIKETPVEVPVDPSALSRDWLARDAVKPISLKQINNLDLNIKKRIYRNLLPTGLLTSQYINPITWIGQDGRENVGISAEPGYGYVSVWARRGSDPEQEFLRLEIEDNAFNGIDVRILLLNDPDSTTFRTDIDQLGNPTSFGTVNRNIGEEIKARQYGLAPGQMRSSLGASKLVFEHLDNFLAILGQQAYFLEPLTYASAWVFERRGCAYVRGHLLMDQIHSEFQPGGKLYQALDGSTPFRDREQWYTVRGRAWAIHDNILEVIDKKWDNVRMVKQVGRHAGVETFPGACY